MQKSITLHYESKEVKLDVYVKDSAPVFDIGGKKSILEYIKNRNYTSDFTQKIHQPVERTKQNQTFRGEYMAWGLAEQDAEKRGYKAGVIDGISQGAKQKAIETAQILLAMDLSLDTIAQATGLSLETLKNLAAAETLPISN